jgi:hypothetical protein
VIRLLGFRDTARSLLALASLAGGRVHLDVPRDGVVEDGGEGRTGFPGGAALVAAGDQFLFPRGDVVCFDLDQLGVAEPGQDHYLDRTLVGVERVQLEVLGGEPDVDPFGQSDLPACGLT